MTTGATGAFFAPELLRHEAFIVRCYRPGDGAALRAATNSSYAHLKPFLAWATPSQSQDEAEGLARRFRANYLLGVDFVLAVMSPDDTRLLGGTGFHLRQGEGGDGGLHTRTAEIGMWIAAEEAGRGLGRQVLQALLAWGLSDAWPWYRLAWRCNVENHASRRVAEAAGMRLEGITRGDYDDVSKGRRDTAVYARLRDDPEGSAG